MNKNLFVIVITIIIAIFVITCNDKSSEKSSDSEGKAKINKSKNANNDSDTEDYDSGSNSEELVKPDVLTGNAKKEWTIIIYSMSDCDLEYFMLDDVIEMSQVGSGDNLNIIVFVDRAEDIEEDAEEGAEEDTEVESPYTDRDLLNIPNFTSGKYLYVKKNEFQEIANLGEPNMGDPKNLSDFVTWAVKSYPANKYALIMSDHGGSATGGYGGDESTEDHDGFDMNEIDTAISSGLKDAGLSKFNIIGFDACLMATYEVASVIKPYADYFIASEELEPGHGWDYSSLDVINKNPQINPQELGKAIIDGFEQQAKAEKTDTMITLSLVDLSKLDNVTSSLDNFIGTIKDNFSEYGTAIGKARTKTIEYGNDPNPAGKVNSIDIAEFSYNIYTQNPNISNVAEELYKSISNAVIYSKNGSAREGSVGLAIYFPDNKKLFSEDYDKIKHDKLNNWRSFLTAYYTGGASIPKPEIVKFLNKDNIGEIIDVDGQKVLAGEVDPNIAKKIVKTTLYYGVVDEENDDAYMIGDMTGMVEDNVVVGVFPEFVGYIKDGDVRNYIYMTIEIDEKKDLMSIDIPLEYYAPKSKEAMPMILSMSGKLSSEEEDAEQEIYYVYNEKSDTFGEIKPSKGAKFAPVLLKLDKNGEEEWIESSDKLMPFTKTLDMDIEKIEADEVVYMSLEIEDFGGNVDYVSYQGVLPKK